MLKKIKTLVFTALFVMLEIFSYDVSAAVSPLLKFKYENINEKYSYLLAELTDIPAVSAFAISVALS